MQMQPFSICEELEPDGAYGVRGDTFSDEAEARKAAETAAKSSASRGALGWKGKISAMLVLDAKNRAIARFPIEIK